MFTAGDQVLQARGVLRRVAMIVKSEEFLADLLIMSMNGFEVILGMDWLSRHQAHLDCGRGRVIFEEKGQPRLMYQGIQPSKTASFVSALRI